MTLVQKSAICVLIAKHPQRAIHSLILDNYQKI